MRLEVRNLRKNFGEKEVLHGISFSIESGKALGLLGRNGAGKTTTIRILMDVFKANAGTITMDGKPFRPKDYQIGYLPEERGLYPKKGGQEQILYLAALRGLDRKTAKNRRPTGWNGWASQNMPLKSWRHCQKEINRKCSLPRPLSVSRILLFWMSLSADWIRSIPRC